MNSIVKTVDTHKREKGGEEGIRAEGGDTTERNRRCQVSGKLRKSGETEKSQGISGRARKISKDFRTDWTGKI